MPYPNFHSCRLNAPGKYSKFRYKKQNGSDLVLGQNESGNWEVQAIRFHKEAWTESAARESCKDKGGSFEPASVAHAENSFAHYCHIAQDLAPATSISFTNEDGVKCTIEPWPEGETFTTGVEWTSINVHPYSETLYGQEIFSTGTWNGDPYTREDLHGIVNAFQQNATGRPVPLKLGHDDEQKFFGQTSGAPALGWVANLRVAGEKLVADFMNVPTKLANLIRKKLYRGKSAEIYWDYKSPGTGRLWPRALKAVSLLGADLPAVTNLNELHEALMQEQLDFAKTYGSAGSDFTCKHYEFDSTTNRTPIGGDNMDAAKEKEYTDQIAALTNKVEEEKAKASESEARAVKAEATLAERDESHAVSQFTVKIESLVKEGKILPPQKDGFIATFKALPVTKTVDGKETKPRDEFVASLEKLPKIIKFGEHAVGDETGDPGEVPPAVAVDRQAKKYMADGKTTYSQAIERVKVEHTALWESYMKQRRA